ncbi:MAG: hypothetical protein Q8M12_02310 [bacterium]|nr:hypothetical protein [bacterium]
MRKTRLFFWVVILIFFGAMLEERRVGLRIIPFQFASDAVCLIPAEAELVEADYALAGCYYYIGGKKHFSAGYVVGDAEPQRKNAFKIAFSQP